jgi:hypothetical protein
MRQHYIPNHEIETIREMLLEKANSSLQFKDECGVCHGGITEFVKKSIWVRGNEVTGRESGKDVRKFLLGHQKLQLKDVSFFLRLFARVALSLLLVRQGESLGLGPGVFGVDSLLKLHNFGRRAARLAPLVVRGAAVAARQA